MVKNSTRFGTEVPWDNTIDLSRGPTEKKILDLRHHSLLIQGNFELENHQYEYHSIGNTNR